jgi:ABC-2 type transport system permease protein
MSALAYTITDSRTLLRRNLRRLRRYPSMTLMLVGMPIVFLLLFVYVFGGQLSHGLSSGLAGGHPGRGGYLNYVTPGILLMTVAATVQGTAIVVAMDMTGGIIDRFRTMAIARAAVLTGHHAVRLRPDLAGHRTWARRQERRDGQQHPDVPHAAPVSGKRLRSHRDHA